MRCRGLGHRISSASGRARTSASLSRSVGATALVKRPGIGRVRIENGLCMRRRPDDVEGGKRAKAFSRVSGGAGNLSVYISRVHKFLYVKLQSEEVIKCQLFQALTNLMLLGLDKSLFRISKSSEHSDRMLWPFLLQRLVAILLRPIPSWFECHLYLPT